MLNDQKRNDEARTLLQRAVQLAPQDSIAYTPPPLYHHEFFEHLTTCSYNNYGSVLHGLGLLDEALREYNVALKLQVPDNVVGIGVYEFA
jgi:tetratricopeptide (TPR) repeat protein